MLVFPNKIMRRACDVNEDLRHRCEITEEILYIGQRYGRIEVAPDD